MIAEISISTLFQLILFSLIPFIWWLFSARKNENFFSWIGLKKPKLDKPIKVFILMFLSLALLLIPGLVLILSIEDKSVLASAKFAGTGFEGVICILIYAILQTSLSEEILFRGFLNKRLSGKFGFSTGNTVQALLFGLLHGVLLFNSAALLLVILIVVFTSAVGWFMGYLNEKLGNGSIVLSWVIHSLTNLITGFIFWFGIITA